MKKLITTILAALAVAAISSHAQTNSITVLTQVNQYTNIVVIPYGKYDFNTKKFGAGAAGLYRVSDNFWSGFRVDKINGYETTAGVQAQLQTTFQIFSTLTATPFVETAIGIGSSSLYGSVGPGVDVSLFKGSFALSGHNVDLGIGIIGDYEHVVQNGDISKNSNQGNLGLRIHVGF